MSTKLIDYLVPSLNESTGVLYEQVDELRELFASSRSEAVNPAVVAMLEAVVSWTEQAEG